MINEQQNKENEMKTYRLEINYFVLKGGTFHQVERFTGKYSNKRSAQSAASKQIAKTTFKDEIVNINYHWQDSHGCVNVNQDIGWTG